MSERFPFVVLNKRIMTTTKWEYSLNAVLPHKYWVLASMFPLFQRHYAHSNQQDTSFEFCGVVASMKNSVNFEQTSREFFSMHPSVARKPNVRKRVSLGWQNLGFTGGPQLYVITDLLAGTIVKCSLVFRELPTRFSRKRDRGVDIHRCDSVRQPTTIFCDRMLSEEAE